MRVRFSLPAPALRTLSMKLEDFDYALPPELIAQVPARERTASRLLHLDGATGALRDLAFPRHRRPRRARRSRRAERHARHQGAAHGRKTSGGRIEVLVERVLGRERSARADAREPHAARGQRASCSATASKRPCSSAAAGSCRLRFEGCDDVLALLERHGAVPLPPYIEHAPDADDEARYQTVYAKEPGAVAAPTAGLHFDEPLLDALRARGVRDRATSRCTWAPARSSRCAPTTSRSTRCTASGIACRRRRSTRSRAARARGGRVLAVGTTTLRALETAGGRQGLQRGAGETKLFIVPGYRFRVVDRLLTNFHLPKSTLLMLVVGVRRASTTSAARTRTPSRSATASTATETPC